MHGMVLWRGTRAARGGGEQTVGERATWRRAAVNGTEKASVIADEWLVCSGESWENG